MLRGLGLRWRAGIVGAVSLWAIAACGPKAEKKAPAANVGRTEALFQQVAAKNGIPVRMLLATAYLESRIQPMPASSIYVHTGSQDAEKRRGLHLAETAFGVTRKRLGLEDNPESDRLEVQLEAYAAWLAEATAELTLQRSPSGTDSKFHWIREIAALHREAAAQRRNIRVVFARQLIEVLNKGFTWQGEGEDSAQDLIQFAPETPPLRIEDMPLEDQRYLNLTMARAEIPRARYFPLTKVGEPTGNNPQGIRVIHCPFSLSACLEIQNPARDHDVRLGAHYVIPEAMDGATVDRVLQVRNHDAVVSFTNSRGDIEEVRDAVVVMLVGFSGRYVDGVRRFAIPTWITRDQLGALGNVINDVCTLLSEEGRVDAERCMSSSREGGLRYVTQEDSLAYMWGDIPDFDPTIFGAYVEKPDGLDGDSVLDVSGGARAIYNAGDRIDVSVRFHSSSELVLVQRLVRCPDQRLVWWTERSDAVLNATRRPFTFEFYDGGPNGTGEQFLRAMVYGSDNVLTGWAMGEVHLRKFNPKRTSAVAPQACRRGG